MKGEFVVEYIGELIDQVIAKKREKMYAQDQNAGCYMYYFQHRNHQYWYVYLICENNNYFNEFNIIICDHLTTIIILQFQLLLILNIVLTGKFMMTTLKIFVVLMLQQKQINWGGW